MGSKPKTPKEDPSSIALRKRQAEQLLQLDEDTNTRIKRMYTAASGLRIARGTADSRMPAANSAMGPGTGAVAVTSDAPGLQPRPRRTRGGGFTGRAYPRP